MQTPSSWIWPRVATDTIQRFQLLYPFSKSRIRYKVSFLQSLTGFKFYVFFLLDYFDISVKETSLLYILYTVGGRIVGRIPFQKGINTYVKCKLQTGFEHWSPRLFLTMITITPQALLFVSLQVNKKKKNLKERKRKQSCDVVLLETNLYISTKTN